MVEWVFNIMDFFAGYEKELAEHGLRVYYTRNDHVVDYIVTGNRAPAPALKPRATLNNINHGR